MREYWKEILGKVLAFGLLAAVVLAVMAAFALLGGGVMKLFGLRYDSPGWFLAYFGLAVLFSIPLEVVSTALPKALYRLGKASRRQANFLYIPLDTFCSAFAFWAADQLIDSVEAGPLAILMASLMFALLSLPVGKETDSGGEPK